MSEQSAHPDGTTTIRPFAAPDAPALIAGRDAAFHRFLGDGSPHPQPTVVIENADGVLVGWVDCDDLREWLREGEVNIGYGAFPEHRGLGHARRALMLFIDFLVKQNVYTTATLLIDPANTPSIAVAKKAGFEQRGDIDGQLLFVQPIPD